MDRSDRQPDQPDHAVAQGGEAAADLALAAFLQREFHRPFIDQPQLTRAEGTVFQRQSALETLQVLRGERPVELHAIPLGDAVAGVAQLQGQFPVVRQDQQPLRLPVEAADGE